MPQETTLGALKDIPDNEAKEYEIEHDDETVEVFVVRKGANFFGYVNYCPHAGTPLNWSIDRFMTLDKNIFSAPPMVQNFVSRTGSISGPCVGDCLAPLDLRLENGQLVLTHPE